MIGCLQLYLSKGMIQCNHINLEKKKLINATCEEFAEYFEALELGKEFQKKDLLENFRSEYEEFAEIQPVRFSRWFKEAAKIRGIKITERKSGLDRFIRLGDLTLNPSPKKGEGLLKDNLDRSFFD